MIVKLGRFATLALAIAAAVASHRAARAEEAAGDAPKPLAVEDYSEADVEVSLLQVKRTTGDTVTVKWKYKNRGDKPARIPALVSDELYLVDAANKKKYFVIKDEKGQWVAGSAHGYHSVDIKEGASFPMWAKFPAPPAKTEKITVYLPGVAPMEDVPISQ